MEEQAEFMEVVTVVQAHRMVKIAALMLLIMVLVVVAMATVMALLVPMALVIKV